MRVLITYSPVTDRFVLELRSHSVGGTTMTETADGAVLWTNDRGEIEVATLSPASDQTGRALLGGEWARVLAMASEPPASDLSLELDVPLESHIADGHIGGSLVRADDVSGAPELQQPVSKDAEQRLDHLLADGVPREIPVPDENRDVRGGVVELPDVSGADELNDPRRARIAWSPGTSEFKIEFDTKPGRGTRLWVRVARGESGDLIALAPSSSDGSVGTIATTIVPHDGHLGELYVDVTDQPLDVIGSSRFRARRRAASLEARAARLDESGRHADAASFRAEAAKLRQELGDTATGPVVGNPRVARRQWIPPLALLLIVLAFLLGRVVGSRSAEEGASQESTVAPTLVETTRPDRDVVGSSEVLAYSPDATIFAGNVNFSLAARLLPSNGESSPAIEFQLYDRAEFAYRDGASPVTEQMQAECLGGLYSSTGSGGGGYSLPVDVVVLGATSSQRASELLSASTWSDDEELGSFTGRAVLIANYTEDCVRRATPTGDKLFLVYRQVFETKSVAISPSAEVTHLVLRSIMDDGSATTWTTSDLMEIRSGS